MGSARLVWSVTGVSRGFGLEIVRPVPRRQRPGRVVRISSLGGFATGAEWGVYNASLPEVAR
jgi:NAD(P)-dependent dehydrogenase (short-subunit alcohol dehydrogenase family)